MSTIPAAATATLGRSAIPRRIGSAPCAPHYAAAMGLSIVNVVPAPRLRFETLNDDGIGWPVTQYSGHVVLEGDPEASNEIAFLVPDAFPATRAPKEPMVVETSLRVFRGQSEPGPVHVGTYDTRVDIVPDPRGGKNVCPQVSFTLAAKGVDHVEVNYRVVVEDS